MGRPLKLTRPQILAHRRRAAGLDQRLPPGRDALERAAWAGLQDSMPRAALLSIHARVSGAGASSWEDPALVQLWGPRFNAYVVAKRDRAVFTRGRLPGDARSQERAWELARRLAGVLNGGRMAFSEAARAMGETSPNRLRYAAPTGTVLMRWDGARQPEIWTVPEPALAPGEARLELAKRHLHVFGPATPTSFSTWAGIPLRFAETIFTDLGDTLLPVQTPIGSAWILAGDETSFLAAPGPAAPARLLPSGDTWYLLQGAERTLLVPDERHRLALWTSRVWPGALLVDGETVGTWRRAEHLLTIQPWQRLSADQREAVEVEAAGLPLPGIERSIEVRWDQL